MGEASRDRIARALERFIAEQLIEETYDGRDPLAAGLVDSLGFEQLVEFAEQEFDVRLADEDMVEENFESLAALATLVESKSGQAPR